MFIPDCLFDEYATFVLSPWPASSLPFRVNVWYLLITSRTNNKHARKNNTNSTCVHELFNLWAQAIVSNPSVQVIYNFNKLVWGAILLFIPYFSYQKLIFFISRNRSFDFSLYKKISVRFVYIKKSNSWYQKLNLFFYIKNSNSWCKKNRMTWILYKKTHWFFYIKKYGMEWILIHFFILKNQANFFKITKKKIYFLVSRNTE